MVSYYKADLGEALVENVLILIVVDDGLVLVLLCPANTIAWCLKS